MYIWKEKNFPDWVNVKIRRCKRLAQNLVYSKHSKITEDCTCLCKTSTFLPDKACILWACSVSPSSSVQPRPHCSLELCPFWTPSTVLTSPFFVLSHIHPILCVYLDILTLWVWQVPFPSLNTEHSFSFCDWRPLTLQGLMDHLLQRAASDTPGLLRDLWVTSSWHLPCCCVTTRFLVCMLCLVSFGGRVWIILAF